MLLGLLDAVAGPVLANVAHAVVVAARPPIVATNRAIPSGQGRGPPVPAPGARRLARPVPAIIFVAETVVAKAVMATAILGEAA